eukprot:jgi/Astpho2/6694/fgenesh1_pg.00101_%23_61_t
MRPAKLLACFSGILIAAAAILGYALLATHRKTSSRGFHAKFLLSISGGNLEEQQWLAEGLEQTLQRHDRSQALDLDPFWGPHIKSDFKHWKRSGISALQIINDTLYIKHSNAKPRKGWSPKQHSIASWCAGDMRRWARLPLNLLILLDIIRTFPGEVPDIDAVMHSSDPPCMPLKPQASDPDTPIVGWEEEFAAIREYAAGVSFTDRQSQLTWRGRNHTSRDELRERFVTCPEMLETDGRQAEADLFNLEDPFWISIVDQCHFRYLAYLESGAWSHALKYRLATGSLVLSPKPQFPEWFTRGLVPNKHYVDLGQR